MSSVFRFGVFEVDARAGELRKQGIRVRLREQSVQILLMLLERPGDIVTREEIRQRLWADHTVVEFDHGINAAVQRLREVLGESAQNPRFIETVARKGYRFLGLLLEDPAPSADQAPMASPAVLQAAHPRRCAPLWIPVSLVMGMILGAAGIVVTSHPAPVEPEVRFLLMPPEPIPNPAAPQMALSPDAKLLAMITGAEGKRSLWVRELRSLDASRLLSDSDFETPIVGFPFWSTDGKFIAFFREQAIWKIPSSGGPLQKVCDAPSGEGGAWNRDGVILFGRTEGPISAVPNDGGKPYAVTQLDRTHGERSHSWPQFLPGGRTFIYLARIGENSAIYAQSMGSSTRRLLLKSAFPALYAPPGFLVFPSGNALMAQAFDAARLELRGSPVPIGQVYASKDRGRAAFSISETGSLAFRAPPQRPHQVVSCDRQGNCAPIGEPTRLTNLTLSPDERYLALTTYDNPVGERLWLLKPDSGAVSRTPFDPGPFLGRAAWSPDSRTYAIAEGPRTRIHTAEVGVSVARPLYATGEPELTLDGWSQDGRSFLLHSLAAVLRLPAGGGGESEKLAEIRGITGLQVSPDGRQVAFAMNTPRPEVYVAEFPSFGGRRLVSTDGGCQPQWRGDGKELFYVAADGYLMATSSGAAQRLFRPGLPLACNWSQYAAGKDGRRFYAYRLNTDAERQADLNIALHWAESLAKR